MEKKRKKCGCTLNQDGECDSCRTAAVSAGMNLQKTISDFIEAEEKLQREFNRKIRELTHGAEAAGKAYSTLGSCRRCTVKYADLSVSKMIRGLQGKKGIFFAKSIVTGVRKKLLRGEIKYWPLTERALAEVCGKK